MAQWILVAIIVTLAVAVSIRRLLGRGNSSRSSACADCPLARECGRRRCGGRSSQASRRGCEARTGGGGEGKGEA